MPETSLSIHGQGVGNIKIEPTYVRGEGGPEYPRVIIPIRLQLDPFEMRQGKGQNFLMEK